MFSFQLSYGGQADTHTHTHMLTRFYMHCHSFSDCGRFSEKQSCSPQPTGKGQNSIQHKVRKAKALGHSQREGGSGSFLREGTLPLRPEELG